MRVAAETKTKTKTESLHVEEERIGDNWMEALGYKYSERKKATTSMDTRLPRTNNTESIFLKDIFNMK